MTLRQVLTAKERHAAGNVQLENILNSTENLGLKRRLGITQWREFSEDMTQVVTFLPYAWKHSLILGSEEHPRERQLQENS